MLVKRVTVASRAELLTAFCTACAKDKDTDQVLCFQRTLAKGEVVGLTTPRQRKPQRREVASMAVKQTLYFPCPGCGARFAQVEETGEDIHAGETYHLQRVRRGGGLRRPEHGDAGRSRQHPVGLPLLPARTLPVGPVQRRAGRLNRRHRRATCRHQVTLSK